MPLKSLNRKEVKHILKLIREHWDAEVDLDFAFFLSGKDNLYIINKEIANVETGKMRINSIGLYFAEFVDNSIRFSIEGSQIVGKFAKKNVVEVDFQTARKWMKGEQIDISGDFSGFVIIKHGKDFLGCGKFLGDKILNYVPKNRRITASD